MARRRFKWTDLQVNKLKNVLDILDDLHEYLPLTLRQIYYQMVSKEYIENTRSQYIALSKLIKWGRIDGHIQWDQIEDRVRIFHDLRGWFDSNRFINASLRHFLLGYKRDLMQSQDKYIEIWIEKDALASIFQRIASPYTIPVVVCRGFTSISFLHEFGRRLEGRENKEHLMLYFGDFDPSGKEMLPAMETTLQDEMGVWTVEFRRIALTPDQIQEHKLPHNPQALKLTDTRAVKHVEQYGYLAVELDALRPDVLTNIVKEAIEEKLNLGTYQEEQEMEKSELEKLVDLNLKVSDFVNEDMQ